MSKYDKQALRFQGAGRDPDKIIWDHHALRKLKEMERTDPTEAATYRQKILTQQRRQSERNKTKEFRGRIRNLDEMHPVPAELLPHIPAIERYILEDWLPMFPQGVQLRRLRNDLAFRMADAPSPGVKYDIDIVKSIAAEVARRNDSLILQENVSKNTIKLFSIHSSELNNVRLESDEEGGMLKPRRKRVRNHIAPYMKSIEAWIAQTWIPLRPYGGGYKQLWHDLKHHGPIPKRHLTIEVVREIAGELAYKNLVVMKKNRWGKRKIVPSTNNNNSDWRNEAESDLEDVVDPSRDDDDDNLERFIEDANEERQTRQRSFEFDNTLIHPESFPRINRTIRPYMPAIEEYIVHEYLPKWSPERAGMKQFWSELKRSRHWSGGVSARSHNDNSNNSTNCDNEKNSSDNSSSSDLESDNDIGASDGSGIGGADSTGGNIQTLFIPKRLLTGEVVKAIAGELSRKGLVELRKNRRGKIKLMPVSSASASQTVIEGAAAEEALVGAAEEAGEQKSSR